MRTTILIKETRTQLVLHPDSLHDEAVLEILDKIPNTYRTNLYDRAGGFTMFTNYDTDMLGEHGQHKDLMIVFDKPEDVSNA